MSTGRSFRSRLFAGSVLWTLGVLLVVSVLLVVFLGTHPRPHAITLSWFQVLPAALPVIAGAALMLAGAQQIRRGLSAVDELRGQLLAVQRGDAPRINGVYPAEVQPLVTDLNALLADREQRVTRAIAQAGDLAHGLKTPLAVLSGEAGRAAAAGHHDLSAAMTQEIDRMRRQIDYQLAGARASAAAHTPGLACQLAPTVDGLVRALARLHAGRGLQFAVDVPASLVVRCAREDVEEMLGNLLDNACKWGRQRVEVSTRLDGAHVVIEVHDDGQGVDEALTATVLDRGVRADQRVPGTGLGLSIVRQLAELYAGSIRLERSPRGGALAALRLPAA